MIKVVDSHHKVLNAWAECRASLNKAPRLITLDHHTDTSPPFRNYIKKNHPEVLGKTSDDFFKVQTNYLKKINFKDLKTVDEAISRLNNDEHIVTAIKTDIISSAFVIAHNAADTGFKTYKDHRIACRSVKEVLSKDGTLRPDHDSVLESFLVEKSFKAFDEILEFSKENLLDEGPFILDIDLDYFNTFKSINPKDDKSFKSLVKEAELITIATEPEYVKNCAMDDGLTSEYLLEALLKIIH